MTSERGEGSAETGDGETDLEARIDALYRGPLASFVARRKELAQALRDAGDRDAAASVGKLRKPVLSAWAVNALADREAARLSDLLEAGEALRLAQRNGDREALVAATARRRAAISDLGEAAVELLRQDGSEPGRAVVHRIERTLEALAYHGRSGPPESRLGRLVEDLEPPGMEALLTLGIESRPLIAEAGPTPPRRDGRRERESPDDTGAGSAAGAATRRRRQLSSQLQALRDEIEERAESERRIARELEEAETRRAAAAADATAARRAAERADERLEEIEAELASLRRRARRADLERIRLEKKAEATAAQLERP